jgi:hypothetical protein
MLIFLLRWRTLHLAAEEHMDIDGKIQPLVVRRECGGWLATTPSGEVPRIGVTAPTEEEARSRFQRAMAAWTADLAKKNPFEAV